MDEQPTTPEATPIPVSPRFCILTMLTEWRDYLSLDGGYTEETGPAPAALIAELARQHAQQFAVAIREWDVIWNDLDGEFMAVQGIADAMERGYIEPPTMQDLDAAWYDTFERVSAHVDLTEAMLTDRGLL